MSNESFLSRKSTPTGPLAEEGPPGGAARARPEGAAPVPGGLRRAAALALALSVPACSGIDAGVEYPDDLPKDIDRQLLTPEGEEDPPLTLGQFKIKPAACDGIDTHPVTQRLAPDDLTRFLQAQGAGTIAPMQARSNLYWFDFPSKDRTFVRLRLAVLDDAQLATKDLHDALLQHGPGWWGVRRSNLAVLAPRASLEEALSFALKYKLVCWGVFTIAGNDDAYVVPGPYAEL